MGLGGLGLGVFWVDLVMEGLSVVVLLGWGGGGVLVGVIVWVWDGRWYVLVMFG